MYVLVVHVHFLKALFSFHFVSGPTLLSIILVPYSISFSLPNPPGRFARAFYKGKNVTIAGE